MDKIFALVDGNCFFCSCERLARPELQNRPVIVLSNNDGCVVSRTKEAKALGIPMGVAYFKVRELCQKNKVAVCSSDFKLYSDISMRMMDVLKTMARDIQVYSVDEAFLDLTGYQGDWLELASEMGKTVWRHVGVPVGVGVAKTKTLAKVANQLAKDSFGICVLLQEDEIEAALKSFPVDRLWGVGKGRASSLRALGIRSAWDLRTYKNPKKISAHLGKVGKQIQEELQGIRCFELNNQKDENKQSILCSRSFSQPVVTLEEIQRHLAIHTTSLALKLRSQKTLCREFHIYFRSGQYDQAGVHYCQSYKVFDRPTNDTFELIEASRLMAQEVFKSGILYKKAGVYAHHLVDEGQGQLSLFEPVVSDEREKLMQVMDKINHRYGKNTLHSGALGANKLQAFSGLVKKDEFYQPQKGLLVARC